MLGIVAFIAIFFFAYQAYRTAVRYEKSPVKWALLVFGAGFGLQLIIPFFVGLAIGIWYAISGGDPANFASSYNVLFNVIGLVFIVASFVVMVMMINRISRVEDEPADDAEPPPPPGEFDI